MIELKSYAMLSHQGPYLNVNEDTAEADIVNNMFLVIDGFGGAGIGDEVAILVKDILKKAYKKISVDPDSTMPFYYSHKYLLEANALINALFNAHNEVSKLNEKRRIDTRGGASVLAAGLSENILNLVSTGNVAAYLLREGELTQEVVPDSLTNLNNEGAGNLNVPMSGIGLFEDLHYRVREIKLNEGDIVLLLSDGIFSRLSLDRIKQIAQGQQHNLNKMIEDFIKFSNESGNQDNQTAIVIGF